MNQSELPLPDGNKPIEIGDPSFIYKGVYHPISWMGSQPYRPRVETLVVQNHGTEIFLQFHKDKLTGRLADQHNHCYSIPGGSLDNDSTKEEQAEAEVNEEALLSISNIQPTGIQYYERYQDNFNLKGGDLPIRYEGTVTDIYIARCIGNYNKSLVDKKDLDDNMAKNGRFYKITNIVQFLMPEHIHALLSSELIPDRVKALLRIAQPYDMRKVSNILTESSVVIPDGKLYHGSTFHITEFKPMSLDLGNTFNPPGWSTFCFDTFDMARYFGFYRALTKYFWYTKHEIDENIDVPYTCVDIPSGKTVISSKCKLVLDNELNVPIVFFVYTLDASNLNVSFGNDSKFPEYTFRDSGIKPEQTTVIEVTINELNDYVIVVDDVKSYETTMLTSMNTPMFGNQYKALLTHDYSNDSAASKLAKAVEDGKLKPGDDVEKYMLDNGISFDDSQVGTIVTESTKVNKPKSDVPYGLPKREAYPLPDEKHVRSAIRFFNYTKPSEEKELAKNINDKIKEFHITDISIGNKNRFKKYYKPIMESTDFTEILSQLTTSLKNIIELQHKLESNPSYDLLQEYYSASDNAAKVITNLQSAIVQNNPNDITLINACDNALHELERNKLESIRICKEAGVYESYQQVVMEAEDEPDEPDDTITEVTPASNTKEPQDNDTEETPPEDEEPDTTVTDVTTTDETSPEENYDTNSDENINNTITDNNTNVKNYFLLIDLEKMYNLVDDVLDSLGGFTLTLQDSNQILGQIIKNLQEVKDFILEFIQFHFSMTNYASNIYYYNVIMQSININFVLLKEANNIQN